MIHSFPVFLNNSHSVILSPTGVLGIDIIIFGLYMFLGVIIFAARDYENFDKFPRYKRILIKLSYVFLWPLKLIQLLIQFIIK